MQGSNYHESQDSGYFGKGDGGTGEIKGVEVQKQPWSVLCSSKPRFQDTHFLLLSRSPTIILWESLENEYMD